MRATISLVLITTFVGGTIPVKAQTQAAQQRSTRADPDWVDVQTLTPGSALLVSVAGLPTLNRYFVAADESGMTVLNVGDTAVPDAVRDILRDMAATHPEYLVAAQRGARFALPKDVQLGPDGVSIGDRHIAGLGQIVERYSRQDIAEVVTAETESSRIGCAFAGYFGGAVVGALPGALIGGAVGRDTGPALVGMMIGWSAGAGHVYGKCRRKPEKVIYSAR